MSGFETLFGARLSIASGNNLRPRVQYVYKIGDRSDFYLILIKATPSDYNIEVRHIVNGEAVPSATPPPPASFVPD